MTLLDENGAVLGRGDDAGGNRLIGTPRWKATFSTEYVKPLSSAIDALVQLDVVYTSKVSWSAAYAPRLATPGAAIFGGRIGIRSRSEEHTSELQSLMRISYAVFCLKKKKKTKITPQNPKYNQNSNVHAHHRLHTTDIQKSKTYNNTRRHTKTYTKPNHNT